MPSHIQDTIDEVNAIITVKVTEQEAAAQFREEFKKYAKNAEIRGFRKGKAPVSYLMKTMGSSMLFRLVYDMAIKELEEYIKSTKILGRPVIDDESPRYDFNPEHITDYEFKFMAALYPEITLQGVDDTTTFTRYQLRVTEKELDEQIDRLLKNNFRSEEIAEGAIETDDIITLQLEELDADGSLRSGGISNEFKIACGDLTEAASEALTGKEIGFSFEADIYHLENNSTPEDIKQYILGDKDIDLAQVNNNFRATVTGITRKVAGEADQAFFDSMFGPDKVHNIEEARAEIRLVSERDLNKESNDLLFYDMQRWLMDSQVFPVPATALRKWMDHEAAEAGDAPETDEQFLKSIQSIRWFLLSTAINNKFEINVDQNDILEYTREKYAYLGQNEDFFRAITEWTMKDEKNLNAVREDIMRAKQLEQLSNTFRIEVKEMTVEEFNQIVREKDVANLAQVEENTTTVEG